MNLLELLNYIFANISFTILDLVAIVLLLMHFGVPLSYYWYMKKKWLHAPWNVKTDPNYKPKITIIIPTYNEAKFIEKKLNNIYLQDYPRDKLEVIVIDSGSTDRTSEKVEQWKRRNPNIKLKLIQEPKRKGKANALNLALKYATGEIVIITDADAWWYSRNTLSETLKWFADPRIGAVSCLKRPTGSGMISIEKKYRHFYNVLRVAESKAWSTPIFHGELAAFRKELLMKIGGFSTEIGSDDSHTATKIALMNYRAITPQNLWCIEAVPKSGYSFWRIRRAQHLIQHFVKIIKSKSKIPTHFKTILVMESFFHLINPWILISAIIILIMSAISGSIMASILILIGLLLLIVIDSYRTWIFSQIYIIIALFRNIYTKELMWNKQNKL